MMRMTAFPASIIAQMLSSGKISQTGAIPQELAVPPDVFISEIRKRDIELKIKFSKK
jgi:saccharopine dehydrogenase-like NADP-dependent oxidoreductase